MKRLGARAMALALLVFPFLLAYVVVLAPFVDRRAATRRQLTDTQDVLAHQKTSLEQLPAFRLMAERLKTQAASAPGDQWLNSPTPTQAAASLQNLVKQLAAGASITVQSVEIRPTASEEGNVRLAMRFVATMPSAALPGLLARIAGRHSPLLLLQDIDIRGTDSGTLFGIDARTPQAISLQADLVAFQRRSEQ